MPDPDKALDLARRLKPCCVCRGSGVSPTRGEACSICNGGGQYFFGSVDIEVIRSALSAAEAETVERCAAVMGRAHRWYSIEAIAQHGDAVADGRGEESVALYWFFVGQRVAAEEIAAAIRALPKGKP